MVRSPRSEYPFRRCAKLCEKIHFGNKLRSNERFRRGTTNRTPPFSVFFHRIGLLDARPVRIAHTFYANFHCDD